MSNQSIPEKNFDELVSKRIRQIRLERGLTLQAVADRFGIAFQQLHKYEAGLVRVSAGMLVTFAEIFECEVADLIPPQLRGNKSLTDDVRLDLLKQDIVNLVLNSHSEELLLALKILLEQSCDADEDSIAETAS